MQETLESGYVTIPEDPGEKPRLIGSRCRCCGEHFFPRRAVCARCLEQEMEEAPLGPRGTLRRWTWVHLPAAGAPEAGDGAGTAVGHIDLPEGPRVQSVLSGGPGSFRIGMPMELEALREDRGGREVVRFRFRPEAA
jgi:uncharacterized OB-fold protein